MIDFSELARRLNFSFVLPDRLAGMAWPFSRQLPQEDIEHFLHGQNVGLVVNLTENAYPQDSWKDIQCVHFPVVDWQPPELKTLDACYKLYQDLPAGQTMVVHCAAGIGRTGTVLAAILGRAQGLQSETALRQLRQIRPGSVETAEQESRIAEWLHVESSPQAES